MLPISGSPQECVHCKTHHSFPYSLQGMECHHHLMHGQFVQLFFRQYILKRFVLPPVLFPDPQADGAYL